MGHSRRTTEGILLLFASFVLLVGFALVFLAKLPALDSKGTVNVNTASADRIGSALMIDRSLAKLIVEHRAKHGPFPSTSALSDVKLLTPEQAKSLIELHAAHDLTKMSLGELSSRAGIGSSVAERLVQVLADTTSVSEARLARIPVVGSDTISRVDEHLRVRDPRGVIKQFWVYAGLLMLGFFILHSALGRRGPVADAYILPCMLILAGLGAIALFSIKDPLRDTDVFTRQIHGVLIGMIAAMIPFSAKFRSFRPWRYTYLYALLAVFLTILLALFGTGPGGARLKLFGFQPVEVVKLALVFFVASYLAERWSVLVDKTGPKRTFQMPLFRDIGPLIVMYLISLTTFLLVKDLGPMLLLFGMFVAMLYVATGKPSFVGIGIALVAVTGWLAYVLHLGVFDVRVDMWLHPWKNAHENGMQLGQALWGLGTGGIWGSGLGLGQPAYMPRSGSDLIFASIGEELGLVGSIFVLMICSVLLVRGFRAALHARTDFDRFLGAGVSVLFGIQMVIIIFGVLGLMPLTGVTFPFASFGKSSVIASFFMAGILLDISANGTRDASDVRLEVRSAIRGLSTAMLVLLLGVAGIGRLVWIQGIKADEVAGRVVITPDADGYIRPHINPRLKAIEASIPRGTIYDRNGRPLATSRPSELEELGLTEEAAVRSRNRCYPYGLPLAHLVGYVDSRCGGPVGFEKWRNNDLRGFEDYAQLLPIYRRRHTPYCPKIEGKDVRLTIDADLQSVVEKALTKYAGAVRDRRTGIRKHKAAAVVIDVYTGEVLAAASIPSFDPNELTLASWKSYNTDGSESALFDRSLNGVYPPGSTFKLVTASAALENGLDPTVNCRHQESRVRWRWEGETYSRRRIADLEEMRPHGLTDLAKAVRVSCNVYFAHLGIDLGPQKLYDMTRKYRLSRIPPPKKLAEDLPDNAYGQGTIQVSPLEMARVVAAIANGGVMMKPQFVKDVRLRDTVLESIEPVEMGRPLDPKSAAALRKMMADVVAKGTGRGVFNGLNVAVAGKTGSAENEQADKMPHSWFVGFAPVNDPRIAFAVVVENGGYGRAVAGPVCREIVKAAL